MSSKRISARTLWPRLLMLQSIIVPRLLPLDSPKRVGTLASPLYITIHETETGHELSPARFNYQMYQHKLLADGTSVGYHFMVEANHDEPTRIYQLLETNVSTDHTGNDYGNAHSLGIERLVNVNTDMERAIAAQAALAAMLMRQYNIPIDHVVPHRYWRDKDCPARLLAGQYGGWNGFIQQVSSYAGTPAGAGVNLGTGA